LVVAPIVPSATPELADSLVVVSGGAVVVTGGPNVVLPPPSSSDPPGSVHPTTKLDDNAKTQ
jgi:hypothetical protein